MAAPHTYAEFCKAQGVSPQDGRYPDGTITSVMTPFNRTWPIYCDDDGEFMFLFGPFLQAALTFGKGDWTPTPPGSALDFVEQVLINRIRMYRFGGICCVFRPTQNQLLRGGTLASHGGVLAGDSIQWNSFDKMSRYPGVFVGPASEGAHVVLQQGPVCVATTSTDNVLGDKREWHFNPHEFRCGRIVARFGPDATPVVTQYPGAFTQGNDIFRFATNSGNNTSLQANEILPHAILAGSGFQNADGSPSGPTNQVGIIEITGWIEYCTDDQTVEQLPTTVPVRATSARPAMRTRAARESIDWIANAQHAATWVGKNWRDIAGTGARVADFIGTGLGYFGVPGAAAAGDVAGFLGGLVS